MGIFNKKVWEHHVTMSNLFGDNPLSKSKVGKKSNFYLNDIQKSFLEDTISKAFLKYPNREILKNQIFAANTLHEKGWVKYKLGNNRYTLNKISLNEQALKSVLGTNVTINKYELGSENDIAYEYSIKQQYPDYNYDTKRFTVDNHIYEYTGYDEFTLRVKPDTSDKEINSKVNSSKLGIYLSFRDYITEYLSPKLDELFVQQFNVDITDASNAVDKSGINLKYNGDTLVDTERTFRVYDYYTWKNHTTITNGQTLQLYEYIHFDIELSKELFKIYKPYRFTNSFFIEYVNTAGERDIFWGKDYTVYNTITGGKTLHFSTFYQLKPIINSKRYRMALEQAGYKNKHTPRGIKRGKLKNPSKDVVTQLAEQEKVRDADIAQYIDLRPFLLKWVRNDSNWRKYLRTIFFFLEKHFTYGTQHKNAPTHMYSMNYGKYEGRSDPRREAGFKIRFIKRKGINERATKLCFISSEPDSSGMYLYLNIPNYDASTPEERRQGIFYNFTQYALDLSLWFSGFYTKECWNSDDERPKTRTVKVGYYNFYRRYGRADYYYKVSDYIKETQRLYEKFRKNGYTPVAYYDNNKRPTVFYDINVDNYRQKHGKEWVNDGLRIDDYGHARDKTPLYHTQAGEKKDTTYLVGYLHHFPEINVGIDDNFNYIPEGLRKTAINRGVLADGYICPLMPTSLWLRVPFCAQKEVYKSTLFLTVSIHWQERESTWIIGVISIILVAVGGYFSYIGNLAYAASFTGAGIAGLGYASGSKELMIAGSIMSMTGSIMNAYTTGFGLSLQGITSAMQVLGTVIQSINMLQSFRNEKALKELAKKVAEDTQATKEELDKVEEEIDSSLKLSLFDVSTDTSKSINNMYKVAYAENVYEAMYDGTYYDTLQLSESKNFDRFK